MLLTFEHFNKIEFLIFSSNNFGVNIKHEPSWAELFGNDFGEVLERFHNLGLLLGPVFFEFSFGHEAIDWRLIIKFLDDLETECRSELFVGLVVETWEEFLLDLGKAVVLEFLDEFLSNLWQVVNKLVNDCVYCSFQWFALLLFLFYACYEALVISDKAFGMYTHNFWIRFVCFWYYSLWRVKTTFTLLIRTNKNIVFRWRLFVFAHSFFKRVR